MEIRDEIVRLRSISLQGDVLLDGAEVVPPVKSTGGLDAREDLHEVSTFSRCYLPGGKTSEPINS